MRINTNLAALLAVLSYIDLSSSLPRVRKMHTIEALIPRAPYAVVPVDGGLLSNGDDDNSPTLSDQNTITTIAVISTYIPTKTATMVLPETTDYVTSTKFVMGPTITQTTEITISSPASATTITMTSYSVIEISPSSSSSSDYETPTTILSEPLTSSTLSSTLTMCCESELSTLTADFDSPLGTNTHSPPIQTASVISNTAESDITSIPKSMIMHSRNMTQPIPTNPPIIAYQPNSQSHVFNPRA